MAQKDFQNAELKGRSILEKYLKQSKFTKTYKFTDVYTHYDCEVYNNKNERILIELKYRENYSSSSPVINNGGILMEKSKYDFLLDEVKKNPSTKCYYTSIFNDGKMLLYEIKPENNITIINKQLPKATAEDRGENVRPVILINKNDCIEITL